MDFFELTTPVHADSDGFRVKDQGTGSKPFALFTGHLNMYLDLQEVSLHHNNNNIALLSFIRKLMPL
jgi:hypothetical protein